MLEMKFSRDSTEQIYIMNLHRSIKYSFHAGQYCMLFFSIVDIKGGIVSNQPTRAANSESCLLLRLDVRFQ